jgi:T5SS/PEP-CTERM-associated repeat protein/autotransporter-associated beta strand protein
MRDAGCSPILSTTQDSVSIECAKLARRLRLVLVVAACGLWASFTMAQAGETSSGDTTDIGNVLVVGNTGTGEIDVTPPTSLNRDIAIIGDERGSIGTISVSGAGAQVVISTGLFVGDNGMGTLSISNGGVVEDTGLGGFNVGASDGSVGMATVSGANSLLKSLTLFVGADGNGELTVSDGGQVTATSSFQVASGTDSNGTVNIGAAANAAAAAPGTISAPSIDFGDGTSKIVFNHTSSNYVFSTSINQSGTGVGSVEVDAGTTILSGANTYNGGTLLKGGTLSVSSDGNLGASSGALTFSGGTLETTASFSSARAVTLTSNGGTIQTDPDVTTTLSGVISDGGQLGVLTKSGAGTLVLTGANTYASTTRVIAGTLGFANNQALGTGDVLMYAGATLQFEATATLDNVFDLSGAGGAGNIVVDTQGFNGTLEGTITGDTTVDLDKTGSGTLTLTVTNFYQGGTTISAGTVDASNSNALGTGAVTVDSGASLEVSNGSTLANDLTIAGTGSNNQGALFSPGDDFNQVNGTITLAADATINSGGNVDEFTLGGPIVLGNFTATLGGANSLAVQGVISGNGGVTVTDSNFVILTGSGSNTYSGLTTVESGAGLDLDKTGGAIAVSGDLSISGVVRDLGSGEIATSSVMALSGNGEFVFVDNNPSETIAGLTSTSSTTSVSTGFGIFGSTTLTLDGAGTYAYAGVLAEGGGPGGGTLALVKSGSGTQILTGANTYSGGTTITAGTLAVGSTGALGAGDVSLNGGTLTTTGGGTGQAINVGGNYTQGSGATLTLNLYAGSHDSLNLTGANKTATLGGTLNLNFDTMNFTPNQGQQYTVVTTVGGIDSPVSTMYLNPETNLAALHLVATGALANNDDDFIVTVTAIQQDFTGLFGGNYLNPNQRGVASNLDGYINHVAAGGNFSPLITALDSVSTNAQSLAGAFDQLMPLNFGNFTSSTAFNNTSFLTQQFDNYLADHRGSDGTFLSSAGGIDSSGLTVNDPDYLPGLQQIHSRLLAWNPAPSTGLVSDSTADLFAGTDMKNTSVTQVDDTHRWNAFISGDAILAQDFSDPGASQAHADTTTGAMQLGVDYRVTPHFLVGAMFGYGHTDADLDNIGSTASVDTYSPALYAAYAQNGWYANALGSYGFSEYDQDRNVNIGALNGTAHSSPTGDQIVGNLDGGYDFHRGAWTFGPTLGVQYVHLDVDGYDETGLSAGDLSVNDNQSDSLRSRLGGRVSYAFQGLGVTFVPHLDASWQHEFLDQSRGITSQFDGLGAGSFSVQTQNPSRDSALADLGLDAQINKTWTVFADYTVQAGQENYFGQSVQAGVKIGF